MITSTYLTIIRMKKICLFAFILALQSCYFFPVWPEDVCLSTENHSNDSLLVYVAWGRLPSNPTVYPDTLLPRDAYVGEINLPHTNDSISGYLLLVPPHDGTALLCTEVNTDYWGHGLYDKFFNEFIRTDVLSVFYISADSVRKYGYDYVASHNIIVARYDLTASDIKSLNMIIPYPPTDAMSGMKIWRDKQASNW